MWFPCQVPVGGRFLGMGESRSKWLHFRATRQQHEIIDAPVGSRHETTTDHGVGYAVSAAKEDLAGRRSFTIEDASWVKFNAILDRPPVFKPRLERQLPRPAPWRDEVPDPSDKRSDPSNLDSVVLGSQLVEGDRREVLNS